MHLFIYFSIIYLSQSAAKGVINLEAADITRPDETTPDPPGTGSGELGTGDGDATPD